MESGPTQAALPLVGLAAHKAIGDWCIIQAVGLFRLESGPTQAALPLVGLAAHKAIGDWCIFQAVGLFRVESGPDASRPPVGRTRGAQSHRGLVYNCLSTPPGTTSQSAAINQKQELLRCNGKKQLDRLC
ncbi:MAG: hypothetical protein R6U98_13845 [Pirellulaceae bacterium]